MRRVDLEFGLSHSVEVTRAEEIFGSALREHRKVLEEPAPRVKVHKLTDSVTQFVVRPWVKREQPSERTALPREPRSALP